MHENSIKDNQDFIREYGKSWKNIEEKNFLWILSCTLLLTFILILIIANRDYANIQKNLSDQITQKYLQTLFSDIKIDIPPEPADTLMIFSKINTSEDSDILDDNIIESGVGDASDIFSDDDISGLNLTDVNLPEALVATKDPGPIERNVRPIQQRETRTVEIGDVKPFDPWETPIQRQGNIQIEPIDEIIRGSQIIRGYRNPDEITFAIQKKESMIEYCFKREAKFFNDLQGYVVVRFIILHTGKVEKSSVKIINSSLRNKKIEMCIIKRLQSWRGFEELDESNGSVAVVQKFIFN